MKRKKEPLLQLKGLLALRILHELKKRALCGEDLATILGKKKGGKLTPGTIYPTLKLLRRKKLMKRNKKGRKKVYSLTPLGKKEYRQLKTSFSHVFKGLLRR